MLQEEKAAQTATIEAPATETAKESATTQVQTSKTSRKANPKAGWMTQNLATALSQTSRESLNKMGLEDLGVVREALKELNNFLNPFFVGKESALDAAMAARKARLDEIAQLEAADKAEREARAARKARKAALKKAA